MKGSSLTEAEVNQAVEYTIGARSTVVSRPRLRATAWLAWAAMTVVGGDIVETGVFTGGSTALMLKQVVQKAARCDTKLWAFDSFMGLPPPSVQDAKKGVGLVGRQGEAP
jgi:predicted DNA repair protein MutK